MFTDYVDVCSVCIELTCCRTQRNICRSWTSFVSWNSTTSVTTSTFCYRDMTELLNILLNVVSERHFSHHKLALF